MRLKISLYVNKQKLSQKFFITFRVYKECTRVSLLGRTCFQLMFAIEFVIEPSLLLVYCKVTLCQFNQHFFEQLFRTKAK
jgi:hypothetical protein